MSEVIGITGGSAGVAASYADARRLADAFDAAGDRLREHAADTARVMRDPDLVESGLLAPHTCALAEAALLAVSGGRDGLLAASLGWEVDARAVRLAIEALEAADDAVALAVDQLDRQLALAALPFGVATVLDPSIALDHPGLVQHVSNGAAPFALPLLDGLFGDEGHAVVTPYAAHVEGRQPETVEEVLDQLHEVTQLSPGPDSPGNGTISVATIAQPDGSVSHIVYLPGTDDFNPPFSGDDDVRDLETGVGALSGDVTPYELGVVEAMQQAGVGPDEPVLVVGHSLGGMTAAGLVAHDHPFTFTNAVTAGSPTAQLHGFPPGTHVLSLEQLDDAVAQIDGHANPDSVEQTTLVFDAHPEGESLLSHHDYGVYGEGAALADSSSDPSVVDAVQSMHDHGFLGQGGQVTHQVFQITRAP